MTERSPISWELDKIRKLVESNHGRISLLLLSAADAIDERDRKIRDLEAELESLKAALRRGAPLPAKPDPS